MIEEAGPMFLIIGMAFIVNIVNTVVSLKYVYTPEYVEKRRYAKEIRDKYRRALMSKDEKQLKKLEQKMEVVKKIETELSFKSIKTLPISFTVFYAIWMYLNNLYGGWKDFIYLPYYLPFIGSNMNFLTWYIFSSIVIGAITRRLLFPRI